jgi:hypothetical protein
VVVLLGTAFPVRAASLCVSMPLQFGVLGVKTLSFDGRATTTSLACVLLGASTFGVPTFLGSCGWLLVLLVCGSRWCTWSLLAGRCKRVYWVLEDLSWCAWCSGD